ncbi:MAG: hypothetical protein IRZ04_10410 [Rhodospirillales bacterium]|nr:hypothetical protein [Rhodospirillales bacterium]
MKPFRRADLDHILRAVKELTGQSRFVLVGSAALIARLRNVPLSMAMSREADIFVDDTEDDESIATLIDGVLGEGSSFHEQFGYYADGVSAATAVMPTDWRSRAIEYAGRQARGVTAVCPEENDIALAKLCAWRDKDRDWLKNGLINGVLDLSKMRARLKAMPPHAPAQAELERRLDALAAML